MELMKLKVLIISRNAWDNKAGNTLSNFFQEFTPGQLAQIYCRDELPDNELCENYYCISEKELISSIFTRRNVGTIITKSEIAENTRLQQAAEAGNKFYNVFRHYRFTLLLWCRELIWLLSKWKNKDLDKFICDFKPDVIYTEAYDTFYTYRVLNYVRKVSNVPYVMFHCDDQLTYRKFSMSPLFWMNRYLLRQHVIKGIKKAAINYCVIDEQQKVYNSIIPANYKILNKCADFNGEQKTAVVHKPIRMVYAGNLHLGRWKTLQKLAQAIQRINQKEEKIILDIYTGKAVSEKKLHKITINPSITIHDFVPYKRLIELQKESDILLHVESFDLKERLITYLSFSTKIVDFFELGKCIVAIGWEKSAPIKYLKENDAAITVSEIEEIYNELSSIVENPKKINEYCERSFNCGKIFHSKVKTLTMFQSDLDELRRSTRHFR